MAIGHKNRNLIDSNISRHEAFKIASMSAERIERNGLLHYGQLDLKWRSALAHDNSDSPVYVVYSYQTPIGWCKLDITQQWTIPSVHYSPTTSRHQAILMVAAQH